MSAAEMSPYELMQKAADFFERLGAYCVVGLDAYFFVITIIA